MDGGTEQMVEQLVQMIIRPPRANYSIYQLGPPEFEIGNRRIVRRDFHILNNRNQKLQCSHFEPTPRPSEALPCVIYLHGNASCRLEALTVSDVILSSGTTLLAVDLSGSGMSDGEYISLGVREKEDVACLVRHLREEGRTSKIALWGRSMGAATTLMYCGETKDLDELVKCCVVDSPFSSLHELADDIVAKFNLPMLARKAVLSYGMKRAETVLMERMRFSLNDLQPIKAAANCHLPVLFIHGNDDSFILPKHSEQIFKEYSGENKRLLLVDGGHDSQRPQWSIDHVYVFLQNHLIAGETVYDPKAAKEIVIAPLNLAEMWKDRGNILAKAEEWEQANEWYTRTIQYLLEEIRGGKLESSGILPAEEEDEGIMKKWFGFFCARPASHAPRSKKNRITETDKFLSVLYSNQSLCYLKKGMGNEALTAATLALKHNPKFVRAFYRKASALISLNRLEEARITMEEGFLVDPGNNDLLKIKSQLPQPSGPNIQTQQRQRRQVPNESL